MEEKQKDKNDDFTNEEKLEHYKKKANNPDLSDSQRAFASVKVENFETIVACEKELALMPESSSTRRQVEALMNQAIRDNKGPVIRAKLGLKQKGYQKGQYYSRSKWKAKKA